MAGVQNFRTSFRGFNRQDVVSYIEYMNQKHNLQVEQLTNQLQAARSSKNLTQLQEQLDAANARIEELEAALSKNGGMNCTELELEAYRRAEKAERQAKERAHQVYQQANAVLADATAKADEIAQNIGAVADQVTAQLQKYQQSVQDSKGAFQEAVATLYAIKPEEEE